MERVARAANCRSVEEVILTFVFVEVPGRGYCWRLHTADGEIVAESPVFRTLQQCLTDARLSAPLNPGTDPYVRRK